MNKIMEVDSHIQEHDIYVDFQKDLEEIEKYNVLEKNNDIFKNEMTINSVRLFYNYHLYLPYRGESSELSVYKDVPLEVLFKSNSSGERVFLVPDKSYLGFIDRIILNINGKKNIDILRKEENVLEDEFYEISKEQLYELCKASSLQIQISFNGTVKWEGEASGFITVLQALYNEAFDNTQFKNAQNDALEFTKNEFQKVKEVIQEGIHEVEMGRKGVAEEGKNKTALIVVGIVLAVIGILMICGADFGSTDSGFGVLILFAVIFLIGGVGLFAYGLVK